MKKKNTIKNEMIEIATINDVEDILRLYPEANKETLAKIKKTVSKEIENAAKQGDRTIFGVRYQDKIVGTVQLVFKDKDYYADGKDRAHIHHTRVSEELRNKGIGSKLIEVAEKEAKQKGFKKITLGVESTNKKAIKFYNALRYKEFMREKGDEGETIIGMEKNL